MTDKTDNTNNSGSRYRSPEVRVISMKVRGVLCQSGMTEGFKMYNGNVIDEDDWN